jgi:type IV pilus assembly protein PilW
MERRSFSIRTARVTRAIAGFSLVELMVAIALSLLLLTGVVAIFSSSRVSYESTDQLSRVQETGRFALEQLSRHIRSAGFAGCSRQPNYVSTSLADATTNLSRDFLGAAVLGYDATGTDWDPEIDSSITGAFAESDVLVVRGPRLDAEPMQLTATMTDPTQPLTVNSTAGVRMPPGEIMMAYSCEAQAIFFGAAGGGTTILHATGGLNASNTTSFPFRIGAEVVPVETVVYFVGNAQDTVPSSLPPNTRSLYRRAGEGAAEELVQGVEQMQVEYGVDTDGDRIVDDYMEAPNVTDWQRVISVQIALLVRSIQQYGTDTDQRTYQLLTNTTVVPPGDRRIREVFQATVSLRNRLRVD